MKPPLGCTNGALWVALARILDEELSATVRESEVNKCRAYLLAEYLRSELECETPGCTGKHERSVQLLLSIKTLATEMMDEVTEKVQ